MCYNCSYMTEGEKLTATDNLMIKRRVDALKVITDDEQVIRQDIHDYTDKLSTTSQKPAPELPHQPPTEGSQDALLPADIENIKKREEALKPFTTREQVQQDTDDYKQRLDISSQTAK
jgi:hypothetical protein